MDFNGKVALITGSSSGIGKAIAMKLASLGAQIVINGRDKHKILEVVKKCESISKQKIIGISADLMVESEVNNLVDKTIEEFGKIDILVNNAGVCIVIPFESPKYLKSYDKAMKMNVRSVQLLTILVVPYLEKTKGTIINISSMGSLTPSVHTIAYSISKCALDMFTKCLALELGPKGIRVNSVNPAFVRTPAFETSSALLPNVLEVVEKHCQKHYPLGRIGESEDVAESVAFLASQSASFITGLILPVDGGSLRSPSAAHLDPKLFINY